jgi:hypothetical protein
MSNINDLGPTWFVSFASSVKKEYLGIIWNPQRSSQ